MAGKAMLMRREIVALAILATAWLVAAPARAQDDEPEGALHRPERQTVSIGDDLLGQLSPDGQTLYFVSNRNQRSEIFTQNVADGRARRLFDESADVTWPRISPDGKQLLYVSFGERVLGQLCVRSLPEGRDRRCLDDASVVMQAEWIDSSRIVAISRRATHGDLRLLELDVDSKITSRALLDRNLTGPTVSPDGQWLVYVPIERALPEFGPAFASHAARRLEAVRMDDLRAPAIPLEVDLPGLSGQPVFVRDGRSLMVVQFIDDTNHDGVIDANDDGILFRIPFSTTNGRPALGPPQQLTEASSNCEYPSPVADRLLATCAKKNGLEIFALPLDGEAPADWTATRLAAELETAGNRSEEQLLASLRLSRETSTTARRRALFTLVRLHLELEQFDAADFYAVRLGDIHDPATEGLPNLVHALIDQRRAVHDRQGGRRTGSFTDQARRRLEDLRPSARASSTAIAFEHVLRSEIADSVGDEKLAREELEAVTLDATTLAPIIEAYYERADALYRELDDREALVGAGRRLAEMAGALTPDERLRYARAAVRAMVRGVPFDDAVARVARERVGLAADSELAFALDVTRELLSIRDAHPAPAVTSALIAIYAGEAQAGRRRALVEETVARAGLMGTHEVSEALVQRYIVDANPGTTERRPAERLFRRVMTARAMRRASEGRLAEARADFDAIAERTHSYEAVVGSIDLRLEAKEPPASIIASYTHAETSLARFGRAYVLARQLPALEGEAATRAAADASALLRASWSELAGQPIANAVRGALLHDRYTRTGDLAFAERANVHYGIALELMGGGWRYRATLLGQLGILHTQVGNYRIAVGYLDDREKLRSNANGPRDLALHLAHARALLHVGREADAATAADRAVALVDREPTLRPYRELALDRAALCNLAAGRFSRALALYDALLPRLATGTRNRFVARVARAAAAVGAAEPARALADLDVIDRELRDPALVAVLKIPQASGERAAFMYELIAMGLRAGAYRAAGRLDDEARALAARRAALAARFVSTERDEDERTTMLSEMQLALNARDRGDLTAAASWVTQALARADDLRARARGQLDNGQLDVLWLAAELTVEMKTPFVPDLPERLASASTAIAASHDSALRTYARWFEVYGPVLRPATPK